MKNWQSLSTLAVLAIFTCGTTAQITSAKNEPTPERAAASTAKPDTPPNVNPGSATAAGMPVLVELSKTVNAKKAKPGDEVKAQVVQDVVSHGKVVIRRGSKLVGHVTEAKCRSKEDRESRLGVVFDKARLKGGGEMPLTAGIRAMAAAASTSMVDRPDQMLPPQMTAPAGMNQSGSPQPIGGRAGSTLSRGTTQNPGVVPAAQATAAIANSMRPLALPENPTYKGSVLSSGSRGVFGIPGLKLRSVAPQNKGYVVVSNTQDVKLESGIQLLLQMSDSTLP